MLVLFADYDFPFTKKQSDKKKGEDVRDAEQNNKSSVLEEKETGQQNEP